MRNGRSNVTLLEPKERRSFLSIEEALGSHNEGQPLISQIADDLSDSAGVSRLLTVHISTPEELQKLVKDNDLTVVIGQPIYCQFEEGPDKGNTSFIRIRSAFDSCITRVKEWFNV